MIDLSPELNPARIGAFQHAQARANREKRPMCVYVAPPNAPQTLTPSRFNVWYVRQAGEPVPEMSELFAEIAPENI